MIRRWWVVFWILLFVVTPAGAQRVFVSTVVIGMSTRAGGDYTFSSVAVPTGVRGLQLTMDLSEAPDPPAVLPAISAALECSLDGGTTWGPAGAFTRTASPKNLNKAQTALSQTTGASFLGGDCWNATTNVNRRLRGGATIGGTLRFSMTVQPL